MEPRKNAADPVDVFEAQLWQLANTGITLAQAIPAVVEHARALAGVAARRAVIGAARADSHRGVRHWRWPGAPRTACGLDPARPGLEITELAGAITCRQIGCEFARTRKGRTPTK